MGTEGVSDSHCERMRKWLRIMWVLWVRYKLSKFSFCVLAKLHKYTDIQTDQTLSWTEQYQPTLKSGDFIRKERGLWMLSWLEATVERWSVEGRALRYRAETAAQAGKKKKKAEGLRQYDFLFHSLHFIFFNLCHVLLFFFSLFFCSCEYLCVCVLNRDTQH